MKAADCGRLAWALKVSGLEAMRGAAVRSGHFLIYAPGAPVYGMTPAPALPYETRLYEEELTHWARYEAAYILMAADARARDCLQKAIADARAAGVPLERYQHPPVIVPVSSGIDVLTAVTLHAAYAAGADVCRAYHYSADAIYTPCTPGYEMLKEWSRKISAEAVGHAAGQVRQQCTNGRARILLAARECTPRFSVFEAKTGIYEREILINASDYIKVASIPNGLLLTRNPNYLKTNPSLFFPGKDDKGKDPKKIRARVSFDELQKIGNWRIKKIDIK